MCLLTVSLNKLLVKNVPFYLKNQIQPVKIEIKYTKIKIAGSQ